MRHCRKIGIQQHYIGNILGCITSCCHGNTAVRFLQCQNIIYTVTGHGNCMLLGLQCLYHLFFLLRSNTAKDTVLSHSLLHLLRSSDRCCINIMIPILKTCSLCNCSYCDRIITGDHFQIHTLAVKKGKGIRCFLSDHVCNKNEGYRLQPLRKLHILCLLFAVSQHKYAHSRLGIAGTGCCKLFIFLRKQELGSTHQISSLTFKNSTTVFPVR